MASHRHSHIVPAGYLRAWAQDERICVGWADGRPSQLLGPRAVGVRSGFYRERYLDGTVSDHLDPVMGQLEDKALRVIRSIEDRWPLADKARGLIAEFTALQLVRTPAWPEWYAGAVAVAETTVRAQRPDRSEQAMKDARSHAETDALRHQQMVDQLPILGTLFVNMHWTLMRCGKPRLATSDHPVVPVASGASRATAISPIPTRGSLATTEFRLALGPRLLLLMTWLDDFGPEPIVKLTIDQVRNHNSVVIRQADAQWFHHPAHRLERASGPWIPLVRTLHGAAYNPTGHRHQQIAFAIDEMLEADPPELDMRVIEWGVPRASADPI
jgi:hypothetical protein